MCKALINWRQVFHVWKLNQKCKLLCVLINFQPIILFEYPLRMPEYCLPYVMYMPADLLKLIISKLLEIGDRN